MGKYQTPYDLLTSMTSSPSSRCLIVADAPYLDAIEGGDGLSRVPGARTLALPSTSPLPAGALHEAEVLVLEVDAAEEASLRRLATIQSDRPDLSVIAALRQTDIATVRTLIRGGVIDVAALPFSLTELETQVLDALSARAASTQDGDLGTAFAIAGAIGGCGCSSVTSHLAAALAQRNSGSRGVCVIDLDLQKGDLASFLGIEPEVSIQTLFDAGTRIDEELMRTTVTQTSAGFSVIAAPPVIISVDRLDIDHLLGIVRLVRSAFDYVLIDMPPMWTDWSLSVAGTSDRLVLVTDTTISGLRQARKTMNLLRGVDIPHERTATVINRLERSMFRTLKPADIERVLSNDVLATISDAGPPLRAAQDQGLLLSATHGRVRFLSDIGVLADTLIAGHGPQR